jgi:chromosome partitioning protein
MTVFLVSRSIKNTSLSKEVLEPLLGYGFPVLKNRTTQRVSYPTSASEGKTVFCTDDESAKEEITAIVAEILEILKHA